MKIQEKLEDLGFKREEPFTSFSLNDDNGWYVMRKNHKSKKDYRGNTLSVEFGIAVNGDNNIDLYVEDRACDIGCCGRLEYQGEFHKNKIKELIDEFTTKT